MKAGSLPGRALDDCMNPQPGKTYGRQGYSSISRLLKIRVIKNDSTRTFYKPKMGRLIVVVDLQLSANFRPANLAHM